MSFVRPGNYPYPHQFKSVGDSETWAKQLYAALQENDRTGEFLRDRAPSADLKALMVRPEWYGAKGNGTTDDTAAINAAATAALAAEVPLVWTGGATYRISSKVTIRCDSVNLGAKINVYGNPAIALVIGYDSVTTPTDSLFGWRDSRRVEIPDIENKAKPATGWTGCGTGILVGNVFESELKFGWVYGFGIGIRFYAAAATSDGAGTCHNHIFLGHCEDNKVSVQLDYGTYGFTNENNFYGGRLHIQGVEGSEIAGTRFLQIGTSTAFGPNNNCFYKPCLEGDGPEYHAEFYGSLNHIEYGRWEVVAVSPKIHFGDVGASYSNGNVIFYGYGAEFVVTTDPLSYNNTIFNREGIAIESALDERATITLGNAAGTGYDSLRIVDPNERPWGDHSADYNVGLSARYLKLKQNGDTYPRIQTDANDGSISFGNGTTAPASALNYTEATYLDGQDQPVKSDSKVSFNGVFVDSLTSGAIPYQLVTEKITDGGLEAWDSATALTSWSEVADGTSTVNRETTAPHGGTYCCRFDTDSLSSSARISQDLTLTASARHRLTFWYKNASGKTIAWQFVDNTTPGSPTMYLNSNGTWQTDPTATAPASATVWTKYEIYFTTSTPTEYRLYVGATYGDNASSSNYIDDVYLREVTGLADSPLSTDGTDIENSGVYRCGTSLYRRYYHIPLGTSNPGASGATWVDADANTTGGWQLNAAGEKIRGGTDIHADWDGASDMKVEVRFMINAAGSNAGDTVDLKLVVYYKGVGDTATKTQTVEVPTTVGAAAQYTAFKADFTLDYDASGNVIEVGDHISFYLNLETDTSEVDDVTITGMSFSYLTTHIGIEDGDE